MGLIITQVDAFTDTAFAGNPAAVCILSDPKDDRWLQNVASEMNLSETAFLLKQTDGYSLRWFTPTVEVDLCGHATLASAHVLWSEGHLASTDEARFNTRSGLLTAKRLNEWIELNFPATLSEPASTPEELVRGLGVPVVSTYQNALGYLVEVDSEASVRDMQPDFSLLKTLPVHGVIVTSRATQSSYDFVSRFFAPAIGIDEDPVTGAAHCCLAPYWSDRLNQSEFLAYQASSRGGVLRVRYQGDRVFLGGQAVTVFRGDLMI